MFRAISWCVFPIVALMLTGAFAVPSSQADDFMPENFTSKQFDEYERKLNALLKTRHDAEKIFVGQIVDQVRLGKIPSKLVGTTYSWVRNKRPNTNYPFVYFERVIRIQATAIGLEDEIPPFDYTIYRSAGQRSIGQNGSAGQKTPIRRNSLFRFGAKKK